MEVLLDHFSIFVMTISVFDVSERDLLVGLVVWLLINGNGMIDTMSRYSL